MNLLIHYLDGEHEVIAFGDHPRARSWRWAQRSLIVHGHDGDRTEYPTANIRRIDICVNEDEDDPWAELPVGVPDDCACGDETRPGLHVKGPGAVCEGQCRRP